MAKYLVETYYTCTFKVNHYLDEVNETELKNLEKRDDGKFEVLDVKLDNRKTKSLDPNNKKVVETKKVEAAIDKNQAISQNCHFPTPPNGHKARQCRHPGFHCHFRHGRL